MGHKSVSNGPTSGAYFGFANPTEMMQPVDFEEALEQILEKDPRFHRDAYFFVRESLDFTQKNVGKETQNEIRHVSGQQLLEGIRDFGLNQFGPMTLTVLEYWGIRGCEDFGEIVFNMVEFHLLAKTDQDSREDFKNGYNFEQTFRQPFLPTRKNNPRLASVKPVADK
jgi:uncharacterized repeat protein (TIGR04138 family)